jgi:hypothetical protein
MRGAIPLIPLLLLAACGQQETPSPKQRSGPAEVQPRSEARTEASREETGDARDAAEALRRYYGLIERGDFDDAWALRSSSAGLTRERFAANFAAYESYSASVGTPSEPVTSGEWDYVEVPVMITGRLKGGKPFGNGGSVSLRRPHVGGAWRIYTG